MSIHDTAVDLTEFLARIGGDFAFLNPVEPAGWPCQPKYLVCVKSITPAGLTLWLAVDDALDRHLASFMHLGGSEPQTETQEAAGVLEMANVLAGHLFPLVNQGDVRFSTPDFVNVSIPSQPNGVGVIFAEGHAGLAVSAL